MNRILCHLVPAGALALALAFASGCFLGHGRDAGERDAGTARPTADAATEPPPRLDAGGPGRIDAGPPPTTCPLVRAEVTCLDPFFVEPGAPFELPVTFGGCGCCVESECLVAVDRASRRLSLWTALCPDPCDCDACILPEARCAVPALEEGTWIVEVNGDEGFELPVHGEITESPVPPGCATYAGPDRCAPSDPLAGSPLRPDEICVTRGYADDVRVELVQDCPGCGFGWGPCQVDLEPRYTDDLPPGGELHVRATEYPIACDVACSAECVQSTRACLVPPLIDGHVYRVWLAGRIVASFVAGDPGRHCVRP